jgi:hypothetical protein
VLALSQSHSIVRFKIFYTNSAGSLRFLDLLQVVKYLLFRESVHFYKLLLSAFWVLKFFSVRSMQLPSDLSAIVANSQKLFLLVFFDLQNFFSLHSLSYLTDCNEDPW